MRTQILEDFQNGSYQVLVSTSILGRGIDLLNVVMVCVILLHTFAHIILIFTTIPFAFTCSGILKLLRCQE